MKRETKQVNRAVLLVQAAKFVENGGNPADAMAQVAPKLANLPGRKPADSRDSAAEFSAHLTAFLGWFEKNGAEFPEVSSAVSRIKAISWPVSRGGSSDDSLDDTLALLRAELADFN